MGKSRSWEIILLRSKLNENCYCWNQKQAAAVSHPARNFHVLWHFNVAVYRERRQIEKEEKKKSKAGKEYKLIPAVEHELLSKELIKGEFLERLWMAKSRASAWKIASLSSPLSIYCYCCCCGNEMKFDIDEKQDC